MFQITKNWGAVMGAGAVILLVGAGCTQQEADQTAVTTDRTVETTERTVEGAGNTVAGATENAGEAAGNAVAGIGERLEPAVVTPRVKTALGATDGLQGSEINVDTIGERNLVVLRGSATSEAQKSLAESVARREASGYEIENQLVVGGAAGVAGGGAGAPAN